MVLAVTGSSFLIDGVEFIPTNMGAEDGGTGIAVAKTPLTERHRYRINQRLVEQRLTHGCVAVKRDGSIKITARGSGWPSDSTTPYLEGVRLTPVVTVESRYFNDHPATDIDLFEAASIAQEMSTSSGRRVRLMTDGELQRLITWDGFYSRDHILDRIRTRGYQTRMTSDVEDEIADWRGRYKNGFVDLLGNVAIWLGGATFVEKPKLSSPPFLGIVGGVSWKQDAGIKTRDGGFLPYIPQAINPFTRRDDLGARFVIDSEGPVTEDPITKPHFDIPSGPIQMLRHLLSLIGLR